MIDYLIFTDEYFNKFKACTAHDNSYFFLETLINLGLRFSRDFIELKVRKWEKLTFPIANSPLSKKNSTPRKRKNTPKPETPMPISVH